MNKNYEKTIENLAAWIRELIKAAKYDTEYSVFWFKDNDFVDEPFSIVGGWSEGFSEAYSDLLCISKSSPKYAMCVKIVVNEGPYAYSDFDDLPMPVDANGNVDDTCVALELEDDPVAAAQFFLGELERITAEHSKE